MLAKCYFYTSFFQIYLTLLFIYSAAKTLDTDRLVKSFLLSLTNSLDTGSLFLDSTKNLYSMINNAVS